MRSKKKILIFINKKLTHLLLLTAIYKKVISLCKRMAYTVVKKEFTINTSIDE